MLRYLCHLYDSRFRSPWSATCKVQHFDGMLWLFCFAYVFVHYY